ncbi:DUF2894 domain-containing protein [Myxococcota bacterium]|nr:DUF2894 domain-containing protein [Myxococcota bacterium]
MNQRLEHMRKLGAAVFDPPAFRFIEGLLSRAASLSGAAGERLERRAVARLDTLEHAFFAAQQTAADMLDQLRREGADPEDRYAQAFERGDFGLLLQDGPRVLRQLRSGTAEAARERIRRLLADAARRGIRLPGELDEAAAGTLSESGKADPRAEQTARALGDRLAQTLYREAAEHVRAAVVVARAHDRLSDDFGLYNPQALAAQALAQLEATSPAYLRHYVAALEDLAILRHLPEPKRR